MEAYLAISWLGRQRLLQFSFDGANDLGLLLPESDLGRAEPVRDDANLHPERSVVHVAAAVSAAGVEPYSFKDECLLCVADSLLHFY